MGKFSISKAEAMSAFAQGVNCCQTVLKPFAERLDYGEDEFMRLGSLFGGGMGLGQTCGTVTGALMVIGMAVGCETEEDRAKAEEIREEFFRRFKEKHESVVCRDILGYDMSDPAEGEKAIESGALFDICPRCMEDSVEILEELLEDLL